MIRLTNGLSLDYSFSSPNARANPKDIVYINSLGSKAFSQDATPLMKYPNLDVLIDAPGGINGFIESIIHSGRDVTAFIDEQDLNRFYVHFLRGIFPNITLENTHRFLRMVTIDQKYSQIRLSTRASINREGRLGLTVPTPMQTRIWYEEAGVNGEFSDLVKENVSIEYLMVHAHACNYSESDPYVICFRRRMEALLWQMLVTDYTTWRRRLLLGIFGLKKNLDLDIDPLADDIEEQISKLDEALGFDESLNEITAANAQKIHHAISVNNKRNNIVEDFKELAVSFFLKDHEITHDEFIELIDADRKRPWSAFFGIDDALWGTGSLIFSYLHSVTPVKISDMVLSPTKET